MNTIHWPQRGSCALCASIMGLSHGARSLRDAVGTLPWREDYRYCSETGQKIEWGGGAPIYKNFLMGRPLPHA
jgi:hypothetical protein